jgi:SAM-dependent methyltransferase
MQTTVPGPGQGLTQTNRTRAPRTDVSASLSLGFRAVPESREVPYPPVELASRVFGLQEWGDPIAAFEEIGGQTRNAIVGLLPGDWSFEGKKVLDFGCGVGRTLRHFLTEAETAEFWGADIDAPSIDWLQANLSPPVHSWRCAASPPMGLEPGSFDLVYAVSVFTHLTDNSLPWLLELHRLLKAGGILIASYMGRWNSEFASGEPWDEDRVGMSVVLQNPDWDSGGPGVLMSDWWVREHWGRAFEILDVAPQIHNMSWAVMRKRDVALTTEDLERPSDDPREYLAVRHSLRHAQRQAFDWAVKAQSVERMVRDEYEQSLSWRVTRPLRNAMRMGRDRRSRRR